MCRPIFNWEIEYHKNNAKIWVSTLIKCRFAASALSALSFGVIIGPPTDFCLAFLLKEKKKKKKREREPLYLVHGSVVINIPDMLSPLIFPELLYYFFAPSFHDELEYSSKPAVPRLIFIEMPKITWRGVYEIIIKITGGKYSLFMSCTFPLHLGFLLPQ